MITFNRFKTQLRSHHHHYHLKHITCLSQFRSTSNQTKAFYTLNDQNCPYILYHSKSTSFKNHNPSDFQLYPDFLNSKEQTQWIDYLLLILNQTYPKRRKSKKKKEEKKEEIKIKEGFEEIDQYDFQSNHFDTVIKDFREHEIRDLNQISIPSLKKLIDLISIDHPSNLMAHILHLSESGRIEAHVDNPISSGPTILGLSLGGERVMHLFEKESDKEPIYKVLLTSGSVYLQRDSVRYSLPHAIPEIDEFQGRKVGGTQRLSLILRDTKTDDDVIS